METSDNGIYFIKSFEGLRLKAYKDSKGVWTIGYGHTKDVKQGDEITTEQAEQFLREDISVAEDEINNHNLNLNQNQFDALVSFVYNVGVGNFRTSTLLRRIKEDTNDPSIAEQFERWIFSGGKILSGLIRRRKAEAELYFKAIKKE